MGVLGDLRGIGGGVRNGRGRVRGECVTRGLVGELGCWGKGVCREVDGEEERDDG